MPLTPGPDQLPLTPEGMLSRVTGGSELHRGGRGAGVTTVPVSTLMSRVVGVPHSPGLGVKLRVTVLPPKPAGLNMPPATPGPAQVPAMPLVEVVGRGKGASNSQSGPMGSKVGVAGVLPSTRTLSKK